MDWLGAFVGAATGVLTGAGIGGGTVLMLYMTLFIGMPQLQAQGTNLLYFLAASPPSLYFHVKNGLVEKRGGLLAAACGAVTCLLGSYLAGVIDPGWLKKGFGLVLLFIGIKEVFAKQKRK